MAQDGAGARPLQQLLLQRLLAMTVLQPLLLPLYPGIQVGFLVGSKPKITDHFKFHITRELTNLNASSWMQLIWFFMVVLE